MSMSVFIRLNLSSFLYALFPFAGIELMANVYRLSRVTGWGAGSRECCDFGLLLCWPASIGFRISKADQALVGWT